MSLNEILRIYKIQLFFQQEHRHQAFRRVLYWMWRWELDSLHVPTVRRQNVLRLVGDPEAIFFVRCQKIWKERESLNSKGVDLFFRFQAMELRLDLFVLNSLLR
jgi:hypothetical protein